MTPQDFDARLTEILMQFAEWTIDNAEHGIHIPLASPETNAAIKALILDEIVGADEEPGRTMGPGVPGFQRDLLRAEQRNKINPQEADHAE